MEQIFVYSKKPVDFAPKDGFEPKEETGDGLYRYTLPLNTHRERFAADALDFIFGALIQNIVENRLRINKSMGGSANGRISSLFSEKLSAYLYITGNKNKIDNIIRSLLRESGVINIDGLVTFRLRELSNDISAFFDLLFYEYNIQKQYDDFIALVRDYIQVERPKEAEIHIVFGRGGFTLYNSNKANITRAALRKYRSDQSASEGSLNDFLISSLLYYLPERIVIHSDSGKFDPKGERAAGVRIIETIKTIFEKRVHCCEGTGCGFCGDTAAEEPEPVRQ